MPGIYQDFHIPNLDRILNGVLYVRKKSCKHCGKSFETDKPGAYLCPDCASSSRRASVFRERVCIDCGTVFMGYPKSKRCPLCRSNNNKRRNMEIRRTGPQRALGSTDICANCGAEYIVESGLQRYCKKCAPEAVRKNINARKREYMAGRAEKDALQKAENRRYNKICLVCGKVFDADTPTVTCSPACKKQLKYIRQAESDYRRGKRKTLPDATATLKSKNK